MNGSKLVLAAIAATAPWLAVGDAWSQCHTQTVTGGTSSVTYSSGFQASGTSLTNLNALDGVYYESSNVVETSNLPAFQSLVETWIETGSDASIPNVGPDYYGGVFVNPTNNPITVTQVSIAATTNPSGRPFFGALVSSTAPTTGTWTVTNTTHVVWAGSVSVAPHSAQEFLALVRPNKGAYTSQTVGTLTTTVTGTGGPYTGTTSQVQVNMTTWAASAVVGFDLSGASTLDARAYVSAVPTGTPATFSIRVRQTDDSNTYAADNVRAGLQLTVTIPKGWSSVSVPTRNASWWNAPTITQPTATTAGSVVVTTAQAIVRNTSTPASSFVIQTTPPTATDATNLTGLYTFTMSLNGLTQGDGNPRNDGQVLGQTAGVVQVVNPVNVQFLSPDLTAGPIRQINLQTYFNVNNGLGTAVESVELDVYNRSTSAWEVVGTATPGSTNTLLSKSFGSTYLNYLSGGKMQLRYVTSASAWQRLRIDLLQWVKTVGYTVNNSTGVDTNVGDVARPYATIAKAISSVGGQGAVYVDVGNSQTGTPYAVNLQLFGSAKSGVASCTTLIQGVANGSSQLPLLNGTNPASDVGVEVGGSTGNVTSYGQVDSFQIANTHVGLYSDPSTTGTVFSNNVISVPAAGYGIILDTSTSATALNNQTDGNNTSTFFGLYDYAGTNNLLDGNKVRRHKGSPGIFSYGSTGLVVQRNIVEGCYIGIHVAHPAGGFKLYNNTLDTNDYLGVYAEAPTATVTSRNNILSNNGVGWGTDSQASANLVSSDYDDVYNNKANYTFHGTVTAGANSISAAPNFKQTTDPTQSTYYQLNTGSPCICAGVNLSLPNYPACTNTNYDIGAVVSH
jgi:hypothetical protein